MARLRCCSLACLAFVFDCTFCFWKGYVMHTVSIILAAGYGTRMKSAMPKVLHSLLGRSLVSWSVGAAQAVTDERPLVVVGHGQEDVRDTLGDTVGFVEQGEMLGTGHAVQQAIPALPANADAVLVTYGDMPLLRAETLQALIDLFVAERVPGDLAMAILTIERDDPQGFGRIVRTAQGEIQAIVEEADCTKAQKRIRELNSGIYCFDAGWLRENLNQIEVSAKGEYYLTDMVAIATSQGKRVVATRSSLEDVYGVNTRVHLAQAAEVMRWRILERHMLAGVTIVNPNSVYIEDTVQIEADAMVLPGCYLQGATQIGARTVVGPNTQIVDCQIGASCRISHSVLEEAIMGDYCEIGPFGHLRKGAHLADHVHMGNFGEVKNSYLASGVKMGHFSYVGDAEIGENVNIGAGTITCNYDGTRKHKTQVGPGAFIGSDSMLVAPVTIGTGAKTGAGSVVTHDVADGEVVYGVPARPSNQDSKRISD
jgi:bifunctional UDP-N-acetylglucosamine pyrophosphorylase/glucosamine-1-phosphate N-acetyltransferase